MLPYALPLATAVLAPLIAAPDDADGPLAAPVRLEADGAPVDSGEYRGYSGPLLADLVGDALPDLLVGSYAGHLQLYENVGEPGAPRFTARGLLQAEGQPIEVHNW